MNSREVIRALEKDGWQLVLAPGEAGRCHCAAPRARYTGWNSAVYWTACSAYSVLRPEWVVAPHHGNATGCRRRANDHWRDRGQRH